MLAERAEAEARLNQAEQELAKARRGLELHTLRASSAGLVQELAQISETPVSQFSGRGCSFSVRTRSEAEKCYTDPENCDLERKSKEGQLQMIQ
ncbi:MAG: hypothetical protein AAF360_15860 [Pseudomonadota bacterium]